MGHLGGQLSRRVLPTGSQGHRRDADTHQQADQTALVADHEPPPTCPSALAFRSLRVTFQRSKTAIYSLLLLFC